MSKHRGIDAAIWEDRPVTEDDLAWEREMKNMGYTSLPSQYIDFGKALTDAGFVCDKHNMSGWIKTISEWMEAGYTPEGVAEAIRSIRGEKNGIIISEPRSITFRLKGLAALKRVKDDGNRYVKGKYSDYINH